MIKTVYDIHTWAGGRFQRRTVIHQKTEGHHHTLANSKIFKHREIIFFVFSSSKKAFHSMRRDCIIYTRIIRDNALWHSDLLEVCADLVCRRLLIYIRIYTYILSQKRRENARACIIHSLFGIYKSRLFRLFELNFNVYILLKFSHYIHT